MKKFSLDGRLSTASKFVRQGAIFADIGTDHAFLPLFLLSEGRIKRAICSDINEGPLASAVANGRASGFLSQMEFVLTDGAAALADRGITDIAIAGMGGELIARIIEDAEFLKNPNIRLILQPMSRQSVLREYLLGAGFYTEAEEYSESAGKYYVTMCVSYDGASRQGDIYELELGRAEFLTDISGAKKKYLLQKRDILKKQSEGKAKGGEAAEAERLASLSNYISSILAEEENP